MGYYAYHRVSSKQQKAARGIDEIETFCENNNIKLDNPIYIDRQSGKNFERIRYTVLKEDVLRAGDTLMITEVDRLGRNKNQIVEELRHFKEKGVRVMILELPTTLVNFNGDSKINNLILETISSMIIELYACLSEAELDKKNKRQLEGLASMKKRGDWERYGRPRAIKDEKFVETYKRVLKGEVKPFEAIKELNVSVPTYYRYKKEYEERING